MLSNGARTDLWESGEATTRSTWKVRSQSSGASNQTIIQSISLGRRTHNNNKQVMEFIVSEHAKVRVKERGSSESALFLGWIENKPLHVVASLDFENKSCFIITAYKPDLEHFESDFKTRRK